jgi:uncharacterized protein YcbK (DUF882 family)
MLPNGRHFTVEEFACRDGTPYPDGWFDRWVALRDLCDAIRDLWGGPLEVVSGYRTPEHNADLMAADNAKGVHGVASSSHHIEGRAADLRTTHGPADVPQLLRVILTAYEDGKLPMLGGVGDYPTSNWVHVDTAKATDGHLRRWHGA